MIDWDSVEEAVEDAKGIAFDTCHKIYVLLDDRQVELMREYEYDEIRTSAEQTPAQMLQTLKGWFEKSCSLRFICAVETVKEGVDPNEGFTTLIEQGATEHEPCSDCLSEYCDNDCEWEDEDEDESEDE